MDEMTETAYGINFATGCIALLASPIGAYSMLHLFKNVHVNLRILAILLSAVWALLPALNIVTTVRVMKLGGFDAATPDLTFQLSKNILSCCMHMIGLLSMSMCLERVAATIYSESYEYSTAVRIIPPIGILIAIIFSLFAGVLFNYFRISIWFIYAIILGIALSNFVGVQCLTHQNRRLRRISVASHGTLTYKYQVIENIRVLQLLRPAAIISVCTSTIGVIVSITVRRINNNSGNAAYFTVFNLYVVAMALYWFSKLPVSRRISVNFRKPLRRASRETVHSAELRGAAVVQTALGQQMRTRQTVDQYFNTLKDSWT